MTKGKIRTQGKCNRKCMLLEGVLMVLRGRKGRKGKKGRKGRQDVCKGEELFPEGDTNTFLNTL